MVIQTWIDFKVGADPALLALEFAFRIAEECHAITDNDEKFSRCKVLNAKIELYEVHNA
jgi:hypothetical protein